MTPAFDRTLFEKAQSNMAFLLDVGVHAYEIPLKTLYQAFFTSGMAERMEYGDVKTIAGSSGTELAYELALYLSPATRQIRDYYIHDRSAEYWLGWSLSYYQWIRNISYKQINAFGPIEELYALYPTYHEMDILQFVDVLDEKKMTFSEETPLKRLRQYAMLSQRELADRTGIPVRTIQQYEQRQKNINHARADYVISLSKTLSCNPEDLLELIETTP